MYLFTLIIIIHLICSLLDEITKKANRLKCEGHAGRTLIFQSSGGKNNQSSDKALVLDKYPHTNVQQQPGGKQHALMQR